VTFDYPRERVVFQPGPRIDEPFAKDRIGLTLTDEDDAVKVILVSASSPAAAAGFSKGETVVAIDGVELRGPALREKFRELRRAPVGTSVRFTMRDGGARTVKLADYY
jgi:C-terminal processing protease CtpA/Prc